MDKYTSGHSPGPKSDRKMYLETHFDIKNQSNSSPEHLLRASPRPKLVSGRLSPIFRSSGAASRTSQNFVFHSGNNNFSILRAPTIPTGPRIANIGATGDNSAALCSSAPCPISFKSSLRNHTSRYPGGRTPGPHLGSRNAKTATAVTRIKRDAHQL